MSTENLFMVGIYIVFGTGTISLLFFPHKIIQFQGFFYRRAYKEYGQKTDEEIDAMYRILGSRFSAVKPSEFIRHAEEDPRRFTREIRWLRILGLLMLMFWIFMGSCYAFLALSGHL